MDRATMSAHVQSSRVARLATISADGRPRLVPCTYVLVDDDLIYTAVDHKPKRSMRLARLGDIERDPRVTLMIDHYDDDNWSTLWWVRIDGRAVIVDDGAERTTALDALSAKYAQYAERPPEGAVIAITVETWRGWEAAVVSGR